MKERKARIGHMYPLTEVKEKEVEIVGGSSEIKDKEKKRGENG
jgi:hypothetical protein